MSQTDRTQIEIAKKSVTIQPARKMLEFAKPLLLSLGVSAAQTFNRRPAARDKSRMAPILTPWSICVRSVDQVLTLAPAEAVLRLWLTKERHVSGTRILKEAALSQSTSACIKLKTALVHKLALSQKGGRIRCKR